MGFLGINFPDPLVLLKLLFSPARGLLFIMPVYVFSLFGLIELFKKDELRQEFWVIVSLVLVNLLVNAGFYGWHGGWTLGPRYLVVMMPFLALPMAFAPLRNKYFYLLLGISVFQVFPGVAFLPYVPELIKNPQFEFIFPLIKSGYFAFNLGFISGLNIVVSLCFWFIIMVLLIINLVRFVLRNNFEISSNRCYAEIKELSIKKKVVSLIAAICIFICLFTVISDQHTVSTAQKTLLYHYHNNIARKLVLKDINYGRRTIMNEGKDSYN